ncbi:MAG: hypothetical protein K2X50_00640 [Gammaproteobacteria bacterium]|nr:hypothetical protein [Gammaproteobacteria bacterium]
MKKSGAGKNQGLSENINTNEVKTVKKSKNWNPFQKLDGEKEALDAAKSGVVVGIYITLSYVIQVAFIYGTGKDTFGNPGPTTLLIAAVITIMFAAFLTWRIWVRQPLWASIIVAIWFSLELAIKVGAIVSGVQNTNVGWILMFLALLSASVLSVRGCWKLRTLRRSNI